MFLGIAYISLKVSAHFNIQVGARDCNDYVTYLKPTIEPCAYVYKRETRDVKVTLVFLQSE